MATFWTTAEPALKGARGPVFHLSQGYEAAFSFYADKRQDIEAAYRLPRHGQAATATTITNIWLP